MLTTYLRTTEAYLYYNLTFEPLGLGELKNRRNNVIFFFSFFLGSRSFLCFKFSLKLRSEICRTYIILPVQEDLIHLESLSESVAIRNNSIKKKKNTHTTASVVFSYLK